MKDIAEIQLMGPRSSGKTTYLASLLALSQKPQPALSGITIQAGGEKIDQLEKLIKNFIQDKKKMPPTDKGEEYAYRFELKFPVQKSWVSLKRKNLLGRQLTVLFKDSSGERINELFESMNPRRRFEVTDSNQVNPQEIEDFLANCFRVSRWMIMLTEWQPEQDADFYLPIFKRFCDEIDERQSLHAVKTLRVAMVMAKCERGEIWPGRLDPKEDLFKVRLPKTYQLLTQRLPAQLRFFACSAYGVLGERDPRPNRYYEEEEGTSAEYRAILRDFTAWKPYGVIEPLYWLSTGQTL
jgi:hypothetical protein